MTPDPNDPTLGFDPPNPPSPAKPPSDVLPADLQYRLVRRLGEGSYGTVYEAEAPGGFRVAIKRITRGMAHPTSQGELEALEAIKTVSHPFLLQTQAYWVDRDQLVIVMELAEGSLNDRIEACRKAGLPGIPPDELIPYLVEAATALDYLHGQNISHRDIKPQNLLYLKGYAKVADFGLARVHQHTQTMVGSVTGTPRYMAPEAWDQHIHLASDQYSLAATYFEARTGQPLFDTRLVHELALCHLMEAPKLPGLPEAERQILLKALAKKPDDRYPTCKAFAEALRDAVLAPPPPPPPPPPSRRIPVLAVVAAALLAGLTVGGVAYRTFFRTDPVVEPTAFWCPDGWEPVAGLEPVALPDGKRYHRQLTREVGGERLTAVAIAPTRPTDPPLFYMLRDKVTNRVFKAAWDRAESDPMSAVRQFRKTFGDDAAALLPGEWKKGAPVPPDGRLLGIDGPQAGVPVVDATMPEAGLIASELGGLLPTLAQWVKAVGPLDDPDRQSAAGNPPYKLGAAEPDGLALGLSEGPWRVDRKTPDVSVHGIRQLITNGFEWTRETSHGVPVHLFDRPPLQPPWMKVVGRSWDQNQVLSHADVTRDASEQYQWDDHKNGIGFRVVLEPK